MIDYENIKNTVVEGLAAYLNCPVIRSNQDAPPPPYPYVSYTVTTPQSQNNGTYGEYDDGIARKAVNTVISFTALSDDNLVSVTLAHKAREWLDYVGTSFLNNRDVTVQSTTSVTNRDNVLTSGYEYKNGFDCTFWGFDSVESVIGSGKNGYIETVNVSNIEIETPPSVDELNERLTKRLDGEVM